MPEKISFYPGPSQLHPLMKEFMLEAVSCGILSMNHRSEAFVRLSQETIGLMKEKLQVPKQYEVYFLSSATECWEVVGQAYPRWPSLHLYNGAFGEKWMEYRRLLGHEAHGHAFNCQRTLPVARLRLPQSKTLICLTHTETSNGSYLSAQVMAKIRSRFPKALIAADATSAMGGALLDWLSADLWFASVQKCFGLPAGMAVMVCGPRAIAEAQAEGERRHYNSLLAMHGQMERWQTTHTPNVLGIFLLKKAMEHSPPIQLLDRQLRGRQRQLWAALEKKGFRSLVAQRRLRAPTVLAVADAPKRVEEAKERAKACGAVLGNGYGTWKENTFRIANFPALADEHYTQLLNFL